MPSFQYLKLKKKKVEICDDCVDTQVSFWFCCKEAIDQSLNYTALHNMNMHSLRASSALPPNELVCSLTLLPDSCLFLDTFVSEQRRVRHH